MELGKIVHTFWKSYKDSTPKKLKIIDVYLAYIVLTGIVQFAYCLTVGTFPFNSFLSGFISTIGSFILGVGLRMQVNPANLKSTILADRTSASPTSTISPERAFADFIFANVVFHVVIVAFVG